MPQNEGEIRINKNLKNNSEEGILVDIFEPKICIPTAIHAFEAEIQASIQKQMVENIIQRDSTNSFKVPENIARILAACEWYKVRKEV